MSSRFASPAREYRFDGGRIGGWIFGLAQIGGGDLQANDGVAGKVIGLRRDGVGGGERDTECQGEKN
jgi:hypothetical protein